MEHIIPKNSSDIQIDTPQKQEDIFFTAYIQLETDVLRSIEISIHYQTTFQAVMDSFREILLYD